MRLSLANQTPLTVETTQFNEEVNPPILAVACPEPGGKKIRYVRRMVFTPENLGTFWERAKKYPTLFSEEIAGDFKKFCEVFLVQVGNDVSVNGLFWVIDDFVGIYYLTHIVPEVDAQVHYSFFDGRQNGREDLTKEMLKYVFNKYNFHRLSAKIPCFAHETTFRFVERLGFQYEGTIKQGIQFKNDWFNIKIFGLLKENHLNGKST